MTRVIIFVLFFFELATLKGYCQRPVVDSLGFYPKDHCVNSVEPNNKGEYIKIDKNGVARSYFTNGKIKEESFHVKRCVGLFCIKKTWIANGKWKFYNEDGKLLKEEEWDHGILKKTIDY